jgi:hypothetical protein
MEVKPALFRSAHKFPKVHRLWDYILGLIFLWNEDRELVAKSSCTESDVEQITKLVSLLNNEMFPFSKEKRALAMKVSLKLLYLVPTDCIPIVFTEKFIRSLYIARVNSKSTLYDFAGSVLAEIESFAGDNQQRILALLTLIAEFGYINFDKAANVKLVQHLMAKMDGESMQQFIKILCANIGDSNDAEIVQDAEGESDEEDDNKMALLSQNILRRNRGVSAIFLFSEMGKHVQPSLRSQQTPIMMSILTRLACFSSGETAKWASLASASSKKDKKSKKDTKSTAAKNVEVTSEMLVMDECIAVLESNERVKNEGPSAEIQEQATLALLSLIHDTKSHLLFAPKQQGTAAESTDESQLQAQKKSATLAEIHIFSLWSRSFSHFVSSGLSNKHVDSDKLTLESLQELAKSVESVLQWLQHQLEDEVKDGEHHKMENFLMALLSVVIIASVHAVTADEIDADIVTRTSDAALRLLLQLQNHKSNNGRMDTDKDSDDEDDEVEDPQLDLLDCSVEFLSVSADQAIKGLRDAIKRMWAAVFSLLPEEMLSQTLIDVLVDVVMGNSRDDDHHDDEENGEEEDDEDDEDAEDAEDEKVNSKGKNSAKKETFKIAKKSAESHQEDDEDDEEDIVIGEGDFMDFMMVDDGAFCDHVIESKMNGDDSDDDSDNEGQLVHTAEADDALGNLIRLRKENRKEGLMALHRKQILLRSRVLDILESFINRIRSGATLFSLLQPLVLGAKKAIKSKILADINEGKTLLQRILSLLSQVSKKKIVIQVGSQEGLEDEFVAELQEMEVILKKMIVSKLLSVRQVAQDMVITLVRIVWASDCSQAQTLLLSFIKELFQQFASKRHSAIPGKYLEDLLVNRFAAIFVPVMFHQFVDAFVSTPILYSKGEIGDMILSVLKRFSNLEVAAKDAVASNIGLMIQAYATVFDSLSKLSTSASEVSASGRKEKEKSFSAKRAKPLLGSLKSLIEILLRSNTGKSKNNVEQVKATSDKLFASLRVTQVASLRQGLQALVASPTAAPLIKSLEEIVGLTHSLEETIATHTQNMPAVPTTPAASGKQKNKAKSDNEAVSSTVKKTDSKKRKASEVDEVAVEVAASVGLDSSKKSKKDKKA